MTDGLTKRRFTVEEYHRMAEAGILPSDERVELIEGEFVMMTPIDPPHAGCVNRLTRLWTTRLGDRAIVQVLSFSRGQALSPAAFPDPTLTADDLLG